MPIVTKPQSALITGASKRLGKAMTLALAQAGYSVGVHYNSSSKAANELVSHLCAKGYSAIAVKADLTSEDQVSTLISKASDALKMPLSVLVNSASAFENDDVDTMTRESWDIHAETNLRAPVKLIQDFTRQIVPGANNQVINMIDQRVWKLTPQFISYTTSKSALLTLTTTLAQALGPKGIRVNAIGPGPTLRNKRQSEQDWVKQNASTVLGHGATPEDIVHALLYLLEARAVTGQMIAVDGGQHLTWQTPDVMINE